MRVLLLCSDLKKIENEGHGRPFQVLEMRKTNPVIADIEMRHPEMPIIKLDPAQIFAPVSPVGRGGCHLGTKSIGCPREAMALLEFRSKQVSAHLEVWISLGPEKSFLSLLLNLRMVKYGKGIRYVLFGMSQDCISLFDISTGPTAARGSNCFLHK